MRVHTSCSLALAGALALVFVGASGASAEVTDVRVLFDLDANPATGCDVATSEGVFDGVESILVFSFEWSPGSVTSAYSQQCEDPVVSIFSAPVAVDEPISPPWPIAPGQGLGGATAIEGYATASMLPGISSASAIRIGVATASAGGGDALSTTDGTPSGDDILVLLDSVLAVPTSSVGGIILLACLLVGAVFIVARHRSSRAAVAFGTLVAVICGAGVARATGLLDGLVEDWSGVEPAGTDVIGDAETGADLAGVFAIGDVAPGAGIAGVFVRVDLLPPIVGGFGVLSGDLDVLSIEVTSPSPSQFDTRIDFGADGFDEPEDVPLLTAAAQEVLLENAAQGGSSYVSEAFSMEMLARGEGAVLLKTEDEIVYDTAGATVDMLISIDGVKLGVSVKRAFTFPPGSVIPVAQAQTLLQSAFEDLNESRGLVSAGDLWAKGILHVFAPSDADRVNLLTALDAIDGGTLIDTIVIITVTDGDDSPLY